MYRGRQTACPENPIKACSSLRQCIRRLDRASRTLALHTASSVLARRCVRRIATDNEALEVANSFKSQWSECVVKLKLVAHLKSAPDRVLPTLPGVVDSKKASRTGAALLQGNYFLIFTTEYLSMDGLGIA